MAAVTLRDLMDPLSKIQVATESSATQLAEIVTAVTTTGKVGEGVQSAMLSQMQVQTALLKDTNSKFAELVGGNKKSDKLGKGGEALKILGAGTFTLSKGLLAFTLVPEKTVELFERFLIVSLAALEKTDVKKVEKGTEALVLMGTNLLDFAKNMAKAALLLIPAALGIPLIYATTLTLVPIFMLLGKQSRLIRRGSRSLRRMGRGLRVFGVGLAAFALSTLFILAVPALIPAMVITLVALGGATALLGSRLFSRAIRKGSLNLALMGIGLAVFGVSYAIFASAFPKEVTMADVLVQVAVIGLIGAAVVVLGFVFSQVLLGSLGLAAIGGALIVFNLGFVKFAKATKGLKLIDAAVMGAAILAVAAATAVVGMALPMVALGAVGLGVMGLGLALFNIGYVTFAAATRGLTFDDVAKQLIILGGIGTVMALSGVALGFTAGTGFLGPLFFIAAGEALSQLADGLQDFNDVEMDDTKADNLKDTLSVVAAAFSGTSDSNGPLGFFKGLLGRIGQSGSGAVASGMYIAAATAMKELALGLNAMYPYISGDKAVDGEKLGKVLGAIVTGFSMTEEDADAVENGIDAVKGAGQEIMNIAKGLLDFDKIISAGSGVDVIADKVEKVITMVGSTFGKIGGMERGDGQGWNFRWDNNKVAIGIDAVEDAGQVIVDLARGLNAFEGVKDPDKLKKKISEVLMAVGGAFADIGNTENENNNPLIFWDNNAIAVGVAAVEDAGEVLTKIAKGVMDFDKFTNAGAVADKVAAFLGSIANIFKQGYNSDTSSRVNGMNGLITQLGRVGKDGSLEKAATSIEKITTAINKVDVDKALAFGELFKSTAKLPEANTVLRDQYDGIKDLVTEIAESIGEIRTSGAQTNTNSMSLNNTLKKLVVTINQLNTVTRALPSTLQTSTFIVSDSDN